MRFPSRAKVRGHTIAWAARLLYRRPLPIKAGAPLISFSFDDFPRSSLIAGGAILKEHGVTGTYYAAFGLMGTRGPVGELFHLEDASTVLRDGHELGCHTYGHDHPVNTMSAMFEASIVKNGEVLNELFPGTRFETFSYPFAYPLPWIKRNTGRHFAGCRGGGQTFNRGIADLSNLAAFFLEQSRDRPQAVKDVIDRNNRAGGWLILSTHDVCRNPSRFGCSPELFEEIVRYSVQSGARILPVAGALEVLKGRLSSSEPVPSSK